MPIRHVGRGQAEVDGLRPAALSHRLVQRNQVTTIQIEIRDPASCSLVGFYKKTNMKVRKQELDTERYQEKKKTRTRPRKKNIYIS